MIALNRHYADLKDSYLFAHIAQKVSAYQRANPNKSILVCTCIAWELATCRSPCVTR